MEYKEVINSKPIVLVEFYASWCPHCQKMMPVVAQVKKDLEGSADVYQYDVDENQKLADSEGVDGIPTFIIYHDGKEVWRNSGEMEGRVLLDKVKSYL